MNSDLARENILGRVRGALRVNAHKPVQPSGVPIFPPIQDLEARFCEQFTTLKGEIIETADHLRAFLGGFSAVATDGSEPVRQAIGQDTSSLRNCDIGVTACDCLMARTGSIFVSTRSAGGRALSVLPPVHLVIARRDQLLADLPAAFAMLRQRYGHRWPSQLTLITGPSRTADIEKILVMGAHGPKRLALHFVA